MSNNMFLTEYEIIITIASLETYQDSLNSPRDSLRQLKTEVKQQLIKSSIEKLENLSIFTAFSKKEYTIISGALLFVYSTGEFIKTDLDLTDVFSVHNKFLKLAGS